MRLERLLNILNESMASSSSTPFGLRYKKAIFMADRQQGQFLKVRPQRENRRYLLWRKITG